jgi:3-oxoadipate CoA-transferase, alpha subunit
LDQPLGKSVASADEALADLGDGASVMISGFGGAGSPLALMRALERRRVRDLTVIINSVRHLYDAAPALFDERRVIRAICSAARGRGRAPVAFEEQWFAGSLEVELVPQGSFAERIRAGGAGIPAFFTPTGVGTDLAVGKEVREIGGRACVLEHALRADFAFLHADVADRFGNVVFRGSQANFGPAMAAAARVAVVEVGRLADTPLDPHRIDVPGIYVDRVVVVGER